ncbi:ras association domain-containing protein 10 isoform X2 [Rhinatrema bivittatum]|uniref:ras association domain-containing protein 10 isoform X2 n=1 Tax=Rhinatrema bivittatum TaxID=194408 RepID=UPI00112EB16F|nr:ras association domain-containing protein 10 isoform X2 [Rhinatrema bivittatum]
MEPEECKISVWLCQEEKLVSGLSRRTTCAEVVRVLLDEHNGRPGGAPGGLLSGAPHAYCLVEKWRGFERSLPNATKLLRLWTAWGEEQANVRFVLVRSDASLPNNGPRSAEARVVPSREGPCRLQGAARVAMSLSQEKQRRLVRKAFRKLAKIKQRRQEARPRGPAEVMETLVHLVLSQDHTIRQQLQRLRELDREIERYEAGVHLDRMQRHGVNYVQDTYLEGPAAEPERGALAELQEYARRGQEVLQLLERLAAELEEELNRRWMERRQAEPAAREPEGDSLEQERVRTELSTSLYIGLRLNTDLEALRRDLDGSQRAYADKEGELQELLDALDCPDSQPGGDEEEGAEPPGVWPEEVRGLGKSGDDEDSDTGLSSMHSQDSDSVPVCESLV